MALNGSQRAATVLAQLDTARAAKLLKVMSEREVVSIMAAMATLPPLDVIEVRQILADFAGEANALLQVGQGGVEVARKLLRDRLGPAKAEEVLEQFLQGRDTHPLSFLQRLDVRHVASFIGDEHPQTVAVVLAHMPADTGAQLLAAMSEEVRADIVRRVATMGRLSPDVVQHIADVLEQRAAALVRGGAASSSQVGGMEPAVAILNRTDRATEKQILAAMEERDPSLAERIRNEMFVFDDVVGLDDRTLQLVLRNVVPGDLAVALKGASEEIRQKFLRNMSERAAVDLAEEIEVLGPTRVSQVEAAQGNVVKIVRELEASGEIVLSRGDDDFV